MTDEQLCQYIDELVHKAYEKGVKEGQVHNETKGVGEFIAALSISKVSGIGTATIHKLMKVAEDNWFINCIQRNDNDC